MKFFKLIMTSAFAVAAMSASAQQIDFSNPAYAKWGATAEEREKNMYNNSYFGESLNNKDYNAAAGYFQSIVAACPTASEAVYARGVVLYKAKIARAKSLDEKKMYVDSLMIVHDLRNKYFGNHPTRGTAYILDSKARDCYNYAKNDREGLRTTFKDAINAAGAKADPALVLLYFQNLCEDYKMDFVMADEVLKEYDELTPFFATLTGENEELRAQFDSAFGLSGVASCENLEYIFTQKLKATPNDVAVLKQAVKMMDRAQCTTPFYVATAEQLYAAEPSSNAAMALAAIFQNEAQYDKASKYLRDALAAESDDEEREKLNSRIALVEMAANRMGAAATAARAALDTPDDTRSDNGIALFVLAQCYASSASSCADFAGQAVYWVAYDTMHSAIQNFSAEEDSYRAPAQTMLTKYASFFPSAEECFFNEIHDGDIYRVTCGLSSGMQTVVRVRK